MIIEDTFRKINQKNISYCIVRNWQDIESFETKGGLEIDIIVSDKDYDRLIKILENQGFYIKRGEETFDTKIDFVDNNKEIRFHVHRGCINYNNIRLIEADNFLKNRRRIGFYYIPSKPVYITGLILHSILDKYFFKDFYKSEIKQNWNENKEEIEELLLEFSSQYGEKIADLIEEEKYQEACKLKWKLIVSETSIEQKLKLISLWTKHQVIQLKKKLNTRNPRIISFVGVDGSGKTTAVESTINLIEDHGSSYEKVDLGVYHERSLPLKLLGKVYRKRKTSSGGKNSLSRNALNTNYQKEMPLRNILLLLDMKWRILKKQVKSPSYIVTDRHFSDIFTHSKPDKISRLMVKILDNSDKIIFLYNDPEVLYERSGERIPEILQEQMNQLEENLEKTGIDFHKIKTDSLSETKNDIEKLLFN